MRCRTCGLLFVDPMPDPSVLMDVYHGDEYFDEYRAPGSGLVGYIASMDDESPYDDTALALLRRYRAHGRMLDVGCAGGRFLSRAQANGYEVAGIEPNAAMMTAGRKRLQVDVRQGTVEEIDSVFGDAAFDVVHMGDVLEHLPDLHGSLGRVSRVLRPGGLLLLQQPITYNRSLFNLLLGLNMLMKADRLSPYPPLHVWEFTPATLRRLLPANGFKVLQLQTFESDVRTTVARTSLKARLGAAIKALSCRISNLRALSAFELGDRALVVAQKV